MSIILHMVQRIIYVINLVLLGDRLDELRHELCPLICDNFSRNTKLSENILIKKIYNKLFIRFK
jgi:hypothetical protein